MWSSCLLNPHSIGLLYLWGHWSHSTWHYVIWGPVLALLSVRLSPCWGQDLALTHLLLLWCLRRRLAHVLYPWRKYSLIWVHSGPQQLVLVPISGQVTPGMVSICMSLMSHSYFLKAKFPGHSVLFLSHLQLLSPFLSLPGLNYSPLISGYWFLFFHSPLSFSTFFLFTLLFSCWPFPFSSLPPTSSDPC